MMFHSQEKDDMLKYVMDEIERVKVLFEEKERGLAGERESALKARDEANARAAAAEERALSAQAEAAVAASTAAEAQARLQRLPQQLEVGTSCTPWLPHTERTPWGRSHFSDLAQTKCQSHRVLHWEVVQVKVAEQAVQAEAKAAKELAEQHRAEAERASKRVAEVEAEMRKVLICMDRQKKASALKMQQLASVVSELQRPFL
jgi:hypothetical protein